MSGVDYSKFEAIVKDVDTEPSLKPPKTVAKYYNSDGDTVSDPSDSDSDSDDEEGLHPLFWSKPPKPGGKNDELQKLMDDMIYRNDDNEPKTANELAMDCKDKGNDFFKWGPKFYRQALKEYKKGLQYSRKGDGSDSNRLCYSAILSNRAAIELKFRNYGSVVRDCKAAIKFGPNPMPHCRAHFRAASACYELGKHKEAMEFINGANDIDPGNSAVLQLQVKVEARMLEQKKFKMGKERELMKQQRLDETFRKNCLNNRISIGWLVNDINQFTSHSVGNMTMGGFPRPTYEAESMQWAVMMMYPESGQSEYIQSFDLHHTFYDHLSLMFPHTVASDAEFAPWDENHDYFLDCMEVYFEERYVHPFNMNKMWTSQYSAMPEKIDYGKRLRVKVPLDKTLMQALSDPQYVVPGIPTFYVVSNRSVFYKDVWMPQLQQGNRIL